MVKSRSLEFRALLLLAAAAFGVTYLVTRSARGEKKSSEVVATSPTAPVSSSPSAPVIAKDPGEAPAGMVWIPGGEFLMGTDDSQANPVERPAHRVRVEGFWICLLYTSDAADE